MALLLVACGNASEVMHPVDEGNEDESEAALSAPQVRLVSPPVWKAGEVVTVLGKDFVSPQHGYTVIRLDGAFVEDGGRSRKVNMSARARFRNSGRVEFVFEPAYPPAGFGYAIGSFRGEISAVNVNENGQSDSSKPLPAKVEIGPSLIIWSVSPADHDCPAEKVTSTLAGEPISIELEAIGLTPTTSYTPLLFAVSYTDAANEPREMQDELVSGTGTRVELDLGELPHGIVETDVLVNLQVEDGHGKRLHRLLPINIALEYAVSYDGNKRVVERYHPVQVSSCLPGGEYGRSVTYSSSESETRTRSVSTSVDVGLSLWVFNAGFNMNVTDSVSSANSESLSMSGDILPGQYGVFYRQTERLERLGQIVKRNVCGEVLPVGEARVIDWNWAPDLAVTQNGQCPPAPPSNLPPAEVNP